ncbi:MAG: hypothetical protein E2598_11940 [Sphingobium sp.]|nr:hypothetical protein [Sphingobium sp.]
MTGRDKAGDQKIQQKGTTRDALVVRRGGRASGHAAIAQKRRVNAKGWTAKKRAAFLGVLKNSCNVREAARSVNMSECGAYDLRRRDPAFAAEWKEALEQGYAELEMLLLRQSIYGSETTETVDDGKEDGAVKTKKVHSYPHGIAFRLLMMHKATVDEYRQQKGIERPGSDAVKAEIQERLAIIRERKRPGSKIAQSDDEDGCDA